MAFPPYGQRLRDAQTTSTTQHDIHGNRVETRELVAYSGLNEFLDWPGVQQVVQVTRTRIIKGVATTETAYAITSLPANLASAERLLALDRGHWGIENRLHYVRDVSMGEDASRVRVGSAPRLLSMFRSLVLLLIRNCLPPSNLSIPATMRDLTYCPDKALALVTKPPFVEN